MSDPLRHDEGEPAKTGRETRIEELLLAGLDHYFRGQHELAVSVWTRVLFLDRSHARARAYIERARGAIAERQREGEELLQTGAAAFQRGDAAGARRLLTSAVERGAPPDEALALLDRLDRLMPAGDVVDARLDATRRRRQGETGFAAGDSGTRMITLLLVLAVGLTVGALVMIYWSAAGLPWSASSRDRTTVITPRPADDRLPVPTAAEVALARTRALYAKGRLREALAAVEAIRPGDTLRPQADELRIDIQHHLLDAARASAPPAGPLAARPR